MAKKPVCLVCQKEMEVGFTVDHGDFNVSMLPRWYPGVPKAGTGTMFGVGPDAKHSGHVIVAYRCPACEALRLYAPSGGGGGVSAG
jgi:hypothetical protein